MVIKLILTFLAIVLCQSHCLAFNALRGKAFTKEYVSKTKRIPVTFSRKVIKGREGLFTKENLESILPDHVGQNETGRSIRSKILTQSAQSLMDTPFIKNSFLFKTAKKVESSAKMDVAIQTEQSSAIEKPIEHKFNFDLQALKQEARIIYEGFIKSKLEYRAGQEALIFSIEEALSSRSRILLTHTNDRTQSQQLLQYQINW